MAKMENWAVWLKGDVNGVTVRIRLDPKDFPLDKFASLHTKEKLQLGKPKPE